MSYVPHSSKYGVGFLHTNSYKCTDTMCSVQNITSGGGVHNSEISVFIYKPLKVVKNAAKIQI